VTEIRDGLEDAAEGYSDAGLPTVEARARAVADFGDPTAVGRALASTLLARGVRLAAAGLGPGYVVMLMGWVIIGGSRSGSGDAEPGLAGRVAVASFGWIGFVAVVTATLGVWLSRGRLRLDEPVAGAAAGGAHGRRPRHRVGLRPESLALLVGLTGVACVSLTWVASYVVQPWATGPHLRELTGLELMSGAVSLMIMAASLYCCSLALGDRRRRRIRSVGAAGRSLGAR